MVTKIDNVNIPDIFSPGIQTRLNESEVTEMLANYAKLAESQKIPTSVVGGSINEFFPIVRDCIISREDSEGVPDDKRLLFLEDDPPISIDTEGITVVLDGRVPGRMDQGPAGEGSIKEVVPHFRASRDHPDFPSEKLITMGKFYHNWLLFHVYAKDHKTARQRVVWFQNLMDGYDWYFRLNGYRVVEDGCRGREKVIIDERTLTRYILSYLVRTDDTFHYNTQELKHLVLNVMLTK